MALASKPNNGSAVVNLDGTVTYTAAEDFVGEDSFTSHATEDGVASNAATVVVTVAADDDGGSDGVSGGGVMAAAGAIQRRDR